MSLKTTTVMLTLLIAAVWLVSCVDVPSKGPTPPEFNAEFRFVSAAEALGDVGISVDGESIGTLSFMGEIAHRQYPAGARVATLDNGDILRVAMTTDQRGTVLVLPLTGAEREFIKLVERRIFDPAATANALARFVHASPDAGDIEVTTAGSETTITETASFRGVSDYVSVPAGNYTITVTTASGDTIETSITLSNMRQTDVLMGSSTAGTLTLVSFVDN